MTARDITLSWVNVRTSGPTGAPDLPSGETELFVARSPYGPCYYTGTRIELLQTDNVTAPVEMAYMLRRKGCLPQPSAPTDATVSVISSSALDLTWTASLDDRGVVSYKVYRGLAADNLLLVETVAAPTVHHHSTGLQAGTHYYFKVTAVDASGLESLGDTDDDTTSS